MNWEVLMKKIIIAIMLVLMTTLLVACNIPDPITTLPTDTEESDSEFDKRNNLEYPGETEPDSAPATTSKDGIVFKKFRYIHVESIGDMYLMRVAPNDNVFKFYEHIESKNNTKWYLCKDISGTEVIPSKTINLEPGDNIYYVMTEKENGQVAMYIVNVYRNKMCSVSFESGMAWDVEQGTVLNPEEIPDGEKEGYIFSGWNFDFSQPINVDTHINGIWTVDPNYVPSEEATTIDVEYVSSNNTTSSEQNVWFNVIVNDNFGIVDISSSLGHTYKFHKETGLIDEESIIRLNASELEDYQIVVKFDMPQKPFALKFTATFRNNDIELTKDIYLLFTDSNVEIIDEEVYQKVLNGELVENT